MIDAKTDGAWRERVEDKINNIQVQVAKLGETQVTGAEVEAKVNTRVSLDAYTGDMRGVNDRLARMEASPQKLLAWVGIGTGCLGVILSFVAVVFGIITWVITHP